MLPVRATTIVSNLAEVAEITAKWKSSFSDEEWVKALEWNATDAELRQVIEQFTNELKIAAAHMAVLVEVLR